MSPTRVPARPSYHLRIFLVCLLLVLAALGVFLFGVELEAIAPVSGVILARDQQDLRALLPGLVELGWYEGEVAGPEGRVFRARVDAQGDGMTDPSQGPSLKVTRYHIGKGPGVTDGGFRFHKLQVGDELWPGQAVGRVRADELQTRLKALQARVEELEGRGEPVQEARVEFYALRDRLALAVVRVPEGPDPWLVLKVYAAPFEALRAGDPVAQVAPLNPETGQPRDLVASLEVNEKHAGQVRPGQTVRLFSTMYNRRLHGHAEARVERLEPLGEPLANGGRHFRGVAVITHAPFPLRAGSSFQGEILLGPKKVYSIILEQ